MSCTSYLKITLLAMIYLMNHQELQFIKVFMSILDLEWIIISFYFLSIKRYQEQSGKLIRPNFCFLNLAFLMFWEDFTILQVNNHLKDLMLSVIILIVHSLIHTDQINANFLTINTLKWGIRTQSNLILGSQLLNLEVLQMLQMTWQKLKMSWKWLNNIWPVGIIGNLNTTLILHLRLIHLKCNHFTTLKENSNTKR